MAGTIEAKAYRIWRGLVAGLMGMALVLGLAGAALAQSGERSLYLYYTHTKETARIVFKRNGQYVQSGLDQLNHFLRDWRRNEPAKMDPRLFDLVWEVYQEVGATQPIHIVSAYRAPATNAMLRSNSSGVAENSLHMRGTAMDFYIPGIPLNRLRAVAMKKQMGGVGYYPTSGSPFVHLDTGSVRAWPRMTTAQLRELFPDGRTLHLPADGKPLSQDGYKLAQADWQKCRAVPCTTGSSGTAVAAASGGSGRTLMDLFFGGGNSGAAQPASAPAPAPTQVAAAAPAVPAASAEPRTAPVPALRASMAGSAPEPASIPFSSMGSAPLEVASAPLPAQKSATLAALTSESGETAMMAIAALEPPVPAPRLHMTNPPEAPDLVTAYAAPMPQDAGAQRALEMIIARELPQAVPALRPRIEAGIGEVHTASISSSLLDATFGAVRQPPAPVAQALEEFVAARAGIGMRSPELVAPDLDHVAQFLVAPVEMSSAHFAVIFEHDVADFDPSTELGPLVPVLGMNAAATALPADRFAPATTLRIASR